MSVLFSDRSFIKREKGRGERTLTWVTPVLKVILTLPMSVWGYLTVVYSYKDFRRCSVYPTYMLIHSGDCIISELDPQ